MSVTAVPSEQFFETLDDPILQTISPSIPTLIIEWDKAPGLFWTLRLAEGWGDDTGGWMAMPRARWSADASGNPCYADARVACEEELAAPLTASLTTAIDGDELRFALALRNDSDVEKADCWAWICMIHRWAAAFQANCELPTGSGDEPFETAAGLPARNRVARWIKGCPIEGKEARGAELGRRSNPNGYQEHILARQGTVRAWRVEEHGTQQFIELHSPDAMLLGWSHWPCTDMMLHFGTLAPGDDSTVTGTLRFFERQFEIAP